MRLAAVSMIVLGVGQPVAVRAQAVGFATIEAVHAGDIGAPWLVDPSQAPQADKPILVRLSNGDEITIPLADGQVGFSMIAISPDRSMLGWAVEQNVCAQSYPCPTEVRLRLPDGLAREFSPPEGVVWHWAFSRDGADIVIHGGATHGDLEGTYYRFGIKTGRLLSRYSVASDAPRWVQDYLERFAR